MTPASEILRTPLNAVAKLPECTGKIAVLGYCLGALDDVPDGRALPASMPPSPITAVTPRNIWARSTGLHAPLLMHLGEEDEFISKAAQAEIKAALASKPNATVYSYPGQRHAFARHNGTHYNAAAAALANGRTSEFLHQQLR